MGEAALRVSRAVNYDSIGTVEFLLDGNTRQFYFLEMNTRVQVEHAVTEAVTGLDLVTAQLRVAAGEKIAISQEELRMTGAAIECRIYAEDPETDFLPSPGRIRRLEAPSGPGIREDTGIYPGWNVPVEYDPLLSKLVAWGPSRPEAIARMRRALAEFRIDGIASNVGFFSQVLDHPAFLGGRFDTAFIDDWLKERLPLTHTDEERKLAVLAAAVFELQAGVGGEGAPSSSSSVSDGWKMDGRRRLLRER
jgi:acetyl-CoA carboxylase biotin carboxylase subunit